MTDLNVILVDLMDQIDEAREDNMPSVLVNIDFLSLDEVEELIDLLFKNGYDSANEDGSDINEVTSTIFRINV